MKTACSKSGKIDIFGKGLTHGFCPKLAIFPSFVFRQYRPGKSVLRYSRTKKMPFQVLKTRSLKSRYIKIFPKGISHGFGPKNGHFSNFFFQTIQARKMSFTIFQNEKTPFQAKKIRSSKSRKSYLFSKGNDPWFFQRVITHGFDPKVAIFPTFF